jgi:hypothetical protein
VVDDSEHRSPLFMVSSTKLLKMLSPPPVIVDGTSSRSPVSAASPSHPFSFPPIQL